MGLNASAFSIGPAGFENDIRTDRKLVEFLTGGMTGVGTPDQFLCTPGAGHTINMGPGEGILKGRNTPDSQGSYFLWSDGTDSVPLPAPQANPYIVTVVQRVIDPQYGSIGANVVGAQWQLVPGSPSATPTPPSDAAINAYGGTLPGAWQALYDIRINPSDSGAIPVGQITDRRRFVNRAGGPFLCTSTTRPTAPWPGMEILEMDTKFRQWWDGTEWVGRPWYIERFRSANTSLPSGINGFAFNDVRLGADNAVTGSASDWGLTNYLQDVPHIRIPATGLWLLNWRFWTSPGVARSYMTRVYTDVPIGTPGVGGTIREIMSVEGTGNANLEAVHQVYLKKGEELRFFAYSASLVTVGPDLMGDPQARSYMRLRFLGRGNR